jgi:hypothetical protein
MSNTYPEITPPPFTPAPYDVSRPQEQLVGSKSFLMTISVIIGIVVGVGIIIGGIGKYVYVERPDYERKMNEIDRGTVTMGEGIKNINQAQFRFEAALDRVENALARQATDIQTIKIDIARGRR